MRYSHKCSSPFSCNPIFACLIYLIILNTSCGNCAVEKLVHDSTMINILEHRSVPLTESAASRGKAGAAISSTNPDNSPTSKTISKFYFYAGSRILPPR